MKYWEEDGQGVVFLSLHNGDDVLECVNRVVREANLGNAILLTGVGSLQRGRIHVIASNKYPPGDRFIELEGPLEISQLGGIVGGGTPHLHITFFDKDDKAWGGHVEPGCVVLTLCEISMRRMNQVKMVRRPRDASGVAVLDVS